MRWKTAAILPVVRLSARSLLDPTVSLAVLTYPAMYYLYLLLSSLIIPYAFANPTLDPRLHRQLLLSGRPQIGLWKALLREQVAREASSSERTIDRQLQQPFQIITPSPSIFEPHCFPQLISHFDDSVNGTFCQRYWVDASSYVPGGPVYLLDGGEISAEYR